MGLCLLYSSIHFNPTLSLSPGHWHTSATALSAITSLAGIVSGWRAHMDQEEMNT